MRAWLALARSEPNQGELRAFLTGLRVVTTVSVGSPLMAETSARVVVDNAGLPGAFEQAARQAKRPAKPRRLAHRRRKRAGVANAAKTIGYGTGKKGPCPLPGYPCWPIKAASWRGCVSPAAPTTSRGRVPRSR